MTDVLDEILAPAKINESAEDDSNTSTTKEEENGEERRGQESSSGENTEGQGRQELLESEPKKEGANNDLMVPSWRVKEIKEKIKEDYEAKLREKEEELQRYKAPKQPEQLPDKETEFDQYIEKKFETYDEVFESIQQEKFNVELDRVLEVSANAFQASTPDYNEAIHDLLSKQAALLYENGCSEAMIPVELQKALRNATMLATRTKRNPAEALYRQAVAMGYKKTIHAAEQNNEPKKKTQDIEKLAQNVAKNRSVSGGGGGSEPTIPNALKTDTLDLITDSGKYAEYKKASEKLQKYK